MLRWMAALDSNLILTDNNILSHWIQKCFLFLAENIPFWHSDCFRKVYHKKLGQQSASKGANHDTAKQYRPGAIGGNCSEVRSSSKACLQCAERYT